MKILAVITARSGSKSIPEKNIIPFCGKPLFAWTALAAIRSKLVTRVITTTDDARIAKIAEEYGSEVPFVRPEYLARDDTPDLPVFRHALTWLAENEGYEPEIVVHLRPTTPLRPDGLIDDGVRRLIDDPEADSIRAVCKPMNNPYKMWVLTDDGAMGQLLDSPISEPYNQPRQKLPDSYWQTGTLDAFRPRTVLEKESMTGERILPLVIPNTIAVDIDDELSLRHAEAIFKRYGIPKSVR